MVIILCCSKVNNNDNNNSTIEFQRDVPIREARSDTSLAKLNQLLSFLSWCDQTEAIGYLMINQTRIQNG